MSFSAGEVFAVLGAKFNPAGFAAYGAAMEKSKAQTLAAEAAMTKSSQRSSAASAAMGRAASTAAKGGILALGAAFVYSVKQAADYEKTLNVFQATAKATDAQMKRVSATAKQLGADTKLPATSAADAAVAMTELAKGGLSVTQTMKAARGVLQLSAAAQISNADAASIVANSLQAFALEGNKATKVADLLAAAANASTASIPDLALGLQQAAAGAHNLGITLPDTVALITELANAGIKGSDAGTSVKTFLASLIPNSKKAGEAVNALGIDVFDQEGKFKGITSVVGQYKEALGKLNQEQRTQAIRTIFGSDASRAATIIFGQGVVGLNKTRDAVNQTGAAQKLAEAQTKGFKGALSGLQSTVETIAINVGEKLLPSLTEGTKAFTQFIDDVSKGKGAAGDVADAFDDVKGAVESARPELEAIQSVLGDLFSGMGPGLSGAVGFIKGAFGVLTGAAKTVGAILRGDLGGAVDGVKSMFTSLGTAAVGAAKFITAPFRGIAAAISTPFRVGVSAVLGLFSTLMNATANVVSKLSGIPVIGGKFKGLADGIRGAANEIDGLRNSINGVKPPELKVNADIADAVSKIKKIQGEKIANKVARIIGDDTNAKTKIKAMIALGIPPKTAELLANAAQLLAGVQTAQGAVNRLHGATVPVNVQVFGMGALSSAAAAISNLAAAARSARGGGRAAGRGAIGPEISLVGEGGGPEWIVNADTGAAARVDRPALMPLGARDYVIPTESRYRGRALGLLAGVARDLGIPAFAAGKGKGTANLGKPIPGSLVPTSLPLETIKNNRDAAKQARDKAHTKIGSLDTTIDNEEATKRDILRRKPKTAAQKANKADDLRRINKKLADNKTDRRHQKSIEAKQEAAFRRLQADLKQAQAYQKEIDKETSLANIAANAMKIANNSGDLKGYNKAKDDRLTHLGLLGKLLKRARTVVKDGSVYSRELDEAIGANTIDIQGTEEEAPTSLFEDGLNAAERGELGAIKRDEALAALTEGLADDTAAAAREVSFFERLLGSAQSDPSRGGDAAITTIAGNLQTARENLKSLTGSGTNTSADLQAQIDQANARTEAANANLSTAGNVIRAFGSSGDIGSGGFANAFDAARGVTVNFQSYVPPSPSEAMRLAGYTVSGITGQNGRVSPRTRTGA